MRMTLDHHNLCISFDGVVGYHVRLTRERSPVRTWVEARYWLVSSVG